MFISVAVSHGWEVSFDLKESVISFHKLTSDYRTEVEQTIVAIIVQKHKKCGRVDGIEK